MLHNKAMENDNQAKDSVTAEVLSLMTDLAFSTKIREMSRLLGVQSANARGLTRLKELYRPTVQGVVLDLTHVDAVEAAEWLAGLNRPDLRALGFFPHVEREIPGRFERFSFFSVVTRSKFEAALREFIEGLQRGAQAGVSVE
jgi:hypothetical protein